MAPTVQEKEKLLNAAEAADLLGTTPGTLATWRSTRTGPKLRHVKLGTAVRYRLTDLLAWIENNTVGGDR